jgi:hypothetical protein
MSSGEIEEGDLFQNGSSKILVLILGEKEIEAAKYTEQGFDNYVIYQEFELYKLEFIKNIFHD